MQRAQCVEPSTGSMTTVTVAPARSCTPDSSLTTRAGARASTAQAAASATRSSAYWPDRAVRSRNESVWIPCTAVSTAAAASVNSSRSASGCTAASSRVQFETSGVRVHVEAAVADETDDGLPEALGGGDRQARRRRHRAQHGYAGHRGLLHELERQSPRHEQHVIAEWQVTPEQRVADELVERIVPADVLAHRQQRPLGRETGGGVPT